MINPPGTENSAPWPYSNGSFWGYSVVETAWCTVSEYREISRSLYERFFTRPWRPLAKTKTVVVQVPHPDVFVMGTQIFGHPATIAKLRDLFQAR